jgi:Cu/Zn superoxide dismutase
MGTVKFSSGRDGHDGAGVTVTLTNDTGNSGDRIGCGIIK